MPDILETNKAYIADNGEIVWIRHRNIRRRGRYIGHPEKDPDRLIEYECRRDDAIPLAPTDINWRIEANRETK